MKLANFTRPPTLTETVASHIRQSIVEGHHVPGAPLREIEMSKSLDVSRGTIREALRYLRDEGLVEIIPHKGATVTRLSTRRARELYTLRAQIEPYAVRLAMERNGYTQEVLEELEGLVQQLGKLLSENDSDPFEIVTVDIEFHRLMCARSDHEVLMGVLRGIQSQTRLFIFHTLLYRSDSVPASVAHAEILDAIRSGDPIRAEHTVRNHILEAGASLVRVMEGQTGTTGLVSFT